MIISVTQRGCGSVQNRRRRVGHEIHSQFPGSPFSFFFQKHVDTKESTTHF